MLEGWRLGEVWGTAKEGRVGDIVASNRFCFERALNNLVDPDGDMVKGIKLIISGR